MYKQGEIYLIRLHPSYDQELKRFRPCIVISDQVDSRFISFVPLSTHTQDHHSQYELPIQPSKLNMLNAKSTALCWYVQTVSIKRLQKQIGKLNKPDLILLKNTLAKLIS